MLCNYINLKQTQLNLILLLYALPIVLISHCKQPTDKVKIEQSPKPLNQLV